ncbi:MULTISPECIES: hypothetical protein [unclassified Paraburkholderia]|uniref:hypothetical protein n=1 Tax=unclassified Paraburkholderia TaxID=2615204 RepID=UPI0016099BF4|nr:MULTISPECIES: hypothetical protein [unclassified Paraburkholderia]MBB5442751.1 hypothetical protein [Paraburkholderia sp. WSM4177]MBB5483644.1 hypothetical protein [Paraburkholderia sp. WSM4180]
MEELLANHVALITGANSGIGGSAPWKISARRPYVSGLFEQWLKPDTRTIGVAVDRLLE